nr:homoserine kinase [Vicinamibacterales bacterium]
MTVEFPFEIAVPGSTANLGPGYDALALALQVYLRLRVERVEGAAPGSVEWSFEDLTLAGENYVERGFRAGLRAGAGVPALRVHVRSEIPMRGGLGSSAAALVAGLRLASRFCPMSDAELLQAATALEGHPDNVSASILGGLTVSCVAPDGRVHALRAPWPAAWRLVVATPSIELATSAARSVVPAQVSLRDAVANLQLTSLLVQAVHAVDAAAMREALRDALHQPHRAALVPGLALALAFESPSLVGVFLSGAGPSIAAI